MRKKSYDSTTRLKDMPLGDMKKVLSKLNIGIVGSVRNDNKIKRVSDILFCSSGIMFTLPFYDKMSLADMKRLALGCAEEQEYDEIHERIEGVGFPIVLEGIDKDG